MEMNDINNIAITRWRRHARYTYIDLQRFPNFFDGGPNLIFHVSWRATEVSSTFSCLHDGRLSAPSAHTSSFKRIWEVYPVASFEFYKKASQVCPLLATQAQVHQTWRAPSRAQTPYSPFFSTTTLPNPPRT